MKYETREKIVTFLKTITIVFMVSLVILSIIGTVRFALKVKRLGDEYLNLAQESPDVNNAIIYLTKYKEAIETNGFTEGSNGLMFKTEQNNMENRYAKLVQGIESLEQIKIQSELSGSDYKVYTDMKTYVSDLDISIFCYLTANNPWYCFLSLHSIWVSVILCFIIIPIVFLRIDKWQKNIKYQKNN